MMSRATASALACLAGLMAASSARADTVYWHTQEFNADGRALYDTLARRTSFIVYQR